MESYPFHLTSENKKVPLESYKWTYVVDPIHHEKKIQRQPTLPPIGYLSALVVVLEQQAS